MMITNLKERLKPLNRFVVFYLVAVTLLWMKTYIVQLTQFDLGTKGVFQHFLLILNPLGSSLFILGIAFLFKGRKKYTYVLTMYGALSILLFANVLYYRYFTDFITLPNIFQTQNFGNLGGSVVALFEPSDFFILLDFFLFILLFATKMIQIDFTNIERKKALVILSISLGIITMNLGLAEADRPQLLTRGFDRNYIVKYLGMYNYTVYDAVESTKTTAQRVLADSNDITEVLNYTKSNYAEPNKDYYGIAKGLNVIYIHLESIQEFLIDYELNGEEVTPFLNSMVRDPHTIYFDNFFHQTAQGKTADAEFLIENSLYGLTQGSAFMRNGRNTYQAAPAILKDYGYTSAVFHGNGGGFWNRNEIYKSFGYDHFYDADYYEIDSNDLAEYGLMDKPFFDQSMDLLTELPQPFYTKFITVSNHHPFHLDPELATIDKAATGDDIVDQYFQTARYADEALAQFFNELEREGLLNHSIIIMYGDHYALSEKHIEAMSQLLGKEITPYDQAGLQRVPLFIRVPGMEGGTNHTYGGQIDLLPTLLHLLGIDTKDYIHFGTDLFSDQHKQIVPFRNGDFVSPEIYSINGVLYDGETGSEITDNNELLNVADEYNNSVTNILERSDKVVNGDLLRFHTPSGFTPINREQYEYSREENE